MSLQYEQAALNARAAQEEYTNTLMVLQRTELKDEFQHVIDELYLSKQLAAAAVHALPNEEKARPFVVFAEHVETEDRDGQAVAFTRQMLRDCKNALKSGTSWSEHGWEFNPEHLPLVEGLLREMKETRVITKAATEARESITWVRTCDEQLADADSEKRATEVKFHEAASKHRDLALLRAALGDAGATQEQVTEARVSMDAAQVAFRVRNENFLIAKQAHERARQQVLDTQFAYRLLVE